MTSQTPVQSTTVWTDLYRPRTSVRIIQRLRPGFLQPPLSRLVGVERVVLQDSNGLRFFMNPASHAGREVIEHGSYEPEIHRLMSEHLQAGDRVLDIGGNEGLIAVMAASMVGATGSVATVEPQRKLHRIIALNAALNGVTLSVCNGALGGADGTVGQLNLYPDNNSGASSIVRRYRFGRRVQDFTFLGLNVLLDQLSWDRIDLVKVDVEGFEPEVVEEMLPLIQDGSIRTLLVDYHVAVLRLRGLDPHSLHNMLLHVGMRAIEGDVNAGSYVCYQTDRPT